MNRFPDERYRVGRWRNGLRRRAATWLSPGRIRDARHGLSLVGIGLALALLVWSPGTDVRDYWSFDLAHPYAAAIGNLDARDAFRYGPPVALLMAPLRLLSWDVVRVGWTVLLLASLWWVARRWWLALLATYFVALEISVGNINILLAAAIVAGFRWPSTWSLVLLTKVTPGIGLVWFAVRREWRQLGIALGATALVCLVSAVLVPGWWPEWAAMLTASVAAPLPGFALPVLWIDGPALLVALAAPSLWEREHSLSPP